MKPLHLMTRHDFMGLPKLKGRCAICEAPHPPGASNSRKYCDPHAERARWQCSKETTAARQRVTGGWRARKQHAERMEGDNLARSIADSALDKGCTKRYCGEGHLYRLTTFDTPCPFCGDHLVPEPVTFDPETDT